MKSAAGSLSAGSHPTVPESYRQAGVNTLIHRSNSISNNLGQNPAAPANDLSASKAMTPISAAKRPSVIVLAGLAVACLCAAVHPAAAQQNAHRNRRETTATRKARIARTIEETYSHRWEVGGGGGFERFRSGQYQQQDNQVTFWASTLYSINPKLGVVGDVRGAYGHAKLTNPLPSGNYLGFSPQISEYNFMAGPSFRFVRKEKFSASVFGEGGIGLGKFAGDSKGLTAADIGVWTGDFAPSFSAGVNLDYNLFPNLAVRVTPNYLGSTFGNGVQNTKGLNIGVVYRFGKIK
jgi:hypothetical protein